MPSGGVRLNGPKVRDLRIDAGHSIRTLAVEVGISPQMIGAVELGDRRPSPPVAKAIADALGVTLKEIRGEPEHQG